MHSKYACFISDDFFYLIRNKMLLFKKIYIRYYNGIINIYFFFMNQRFERPINQRFVVSDQ